MVAERAGELGLQGACHLLGGRLSLGLPSSHYCRQGVGVGVGIKESVVQLLQERSAVKGKSKNLVVAQSHRLVVSAGLLCKLES